MTVVATVRHSRPARRIARRPRHRARGLGDLQTSQTDYQLASIGVQAAGAAAAAAISTGAIAASTVWIPIIGPMVAAATLGLGLIFNRKSARQKVAATQDANAAEDKLKQLVQGYLDGPRTKVRQAWALSVVDQTFAWLQSQDGCGNPDLGEAGQRCINERIGPAPRRFDWIAWYRDPIANDPQVIDDPVVNEANSLLPNLTQGQLDLVHKYWLPAALGLVALLAW
jgi:hypothetical protein